MKTILKKAKRTLSLLLVLLMVVPMTILLAVPSSSTEETVKYEVEGGCIYFDSSAGAIIDCDESVTNAVIPSMIEGVSVVTIGSHSFADCTSLTSISIPDSVTTIRDWWCVGCTSLTSIKVDKENKFFCDIDGVVFSKDQTTLISCPTGKKGIYIVPDTTTAIKEWAFTYCDSLTSVIIADSVTSVGDCAFRYCSSLSSITVGSGVTSISDNPFLDCDSLTSIKVDKDNKFLSDIDGVIFSKDQTTLICYPKSKKGIYTIPTCVTSIADAAFRECTSLTSVTIPDTVKSIGLMAFYFCESLTSVTLPDSVTSIGDWAFFGCGSLKSINIPNGVTRIERYTFGVCYSLTSIIIGDGVTSIDDNAFEQCSSLESVFYCGNNDSWNKIFIGTANYELINARRFYHNFSNWVVTSESTVFEKGEQSRKCKNCDTIETEELEKLEMINPFIDVKNGRWYTDGILWCYYKGYMAGVSETVFDYKGNVTRAMFVTILAKIDGSDISGYSNMSFSDVKPGKWYSNAIEWAASNGYAAGLGEGIFGYKQNVSREQIALFFYTYSEKNGIDVAEEADLSGYADLGRVHSWALDAMEWAVAKGLIGGTSETTLSPRDSATRAEIALIVKNFVENVKP